MVRQGDFELRLVQADGQPFPEVEHKGKAIAVAAPGREFNVQVIHHPSAYAPRQAPGTFLNVGEAASLLPDSISPASAPKAPLGRRSPPPTTHSPCLQAPLHVDGQGVGYTKHMFGPSTANFDGFLKAGGEHKTAAGGTGIA